MDDAKSITWDFPVTAAIEIVKAGAIFDAAQAEYEAKAAAAAARIRGARRRASRETTLSSLPAVVTIETLRPFTFSIWS